MRYFCRSVIFLCLFAGPAFADKTKDHIKKGGTGVGVTTLLEYVKRAGNRLG